MKKILIVEDTPDVLENLTDFLSMEGYEVLKCRNAFEGLLKLDSQNPDLIITDLKMPGMDGFELIETLKTKEKSKHIPIIIFSANATPENEKKSVQLGVIDFIKKPSTMEVLLEKIENALL